MTSAGAGGKGGQGAEGGGTTPRLLAWQLEAEGTAPLVVGIYDQREQLHCQFFEDSEGQLRCLPVAALGVEVRPWHVDAGCTLPVYGVSPGLVERFEGRPLTVPVAASDCEPERFYVATLSTLADDLALRLQPSASCRLATDACSSIN